MVTRHAHTRKKSFVTRVSEDALNAIADSGLASHQCVDVWRWQAAHSGTTFEEAVLAMSAEGNGVLGG